MARKRKSEKQPTPKAEVQKIAVRITSQEEWDKITELLNHSWITGSFNTYPDPCIDIYKKQYDPISWYLGLGYKIIEFDEFLNINNNLI